MDLTSCILVKFLVVHTFVARRFQVRLDARAPSGESSNYLLRRLSCNVEDLTPSTLVTFVPTSAEIRLMAFYLNPDFIDVSLKI